ncbi:hypothetical protein ACLHWQ_12425 [Flavobacterium psychrophilum]|uniref:hypothetical protein n=1 Tax=Flavobacterium psychrophilum TaxID=96345 RepID=UPI003984DA1C
MKKLIDLDQTTLTKLKMLSVFEHLSVKALIENAVCTYVKNKKKNASINLPMKKKKIWDC